LYYFQIAQAQQWINQLNFVILIREYYKLLGEIQQNKTKVSQKNISSSIKKLSQRQKIVLRHIKEAGPVRMRDLIILFPKLTSRTIRNDLNKLIDKEFLLHQGRGRSSFYKINKENIREINNL
jgi:predicted HTH transcriptional regulator